MLPRDYQLDVVTDKPLHVDFVRLKAGSKVRIGVPVHVVNREASPGMKKGGAVNLVLHTVELIAPADAIPEAITIDLAGLDFHDGCTSRHQAARGLPPGGHARPTSPWSRWCRRPSTPRRRRRRRRAAAAPAGARGRRRRRPPPAKGAARRAPAKGAAAAAPRQGRRRPAKPAGKK